MADHPKPIEGHLVELGWNPSRLSDEDRRQIALVVIGAYIDGIAGLTYLRDPYNDFHTLDGYRLRYVVEDAGR